MTDENGGTPDADDSERADVSSPSEKVEECFDLAVKEAKENLGNAVPGPAWHGYLASSLTQIQVTREDYTRTLRNLISLIFVWVAASAYVASFPFGKQMSTVEEAIIWGIALGMLVLVLPVTRVASSKARSNYDLYAATSIHAAILHKAIGLGQTHEWFAHVYRCIRTLDKIDEDDGPDFSYETHWKRMVINRWKRSSGLQRGQNLLKSFEYLILWIQVSVCLAILVGAILVGIHTEFLSHLWIYFELA